MSKDFWAAVRDSAELVEKAPAWMKAGITLNGAHFETFSPGDMVNLIEKHKCIRCDAWRMKDSTECKGCCLNRKKRLETAKHKTKKFIKWLRGCRKLSHRTKLTHHLLHAPISDKRRLLAAGVSIYLASLCTFEEKEKELMAQVKPLILKAFLS